MPYEQFLMAEKALPIKPITPLDYRKLFIDIEGIKNAWLKNMKKQFMPIVKIIN